MDIPHIKKEELTIEKVTDYLCDAPDGKIEIKRIGPVIQFIVGGKLIGFLKGKNESEYTMWIPTGGTWAKIELPDLSTFTEKPMSDHEFSAYLFSLDPEWEYLLVGTEYAQYFAKGRIAALAKYKNSPPVSRRVWVPKEAV